MTTPGGTLEPRSPLPVTSIDEVRPRGSLSGIGLGVSLALNVLSAQFSTVTVTVAVAVAPWLSVAVAVNTRLPFATLVVSNVVEYGVVEHERAF